MNPIRSCRGLGVFPRVVGCLVLLASAQAQSQTAELAPDIFLLAGWSAYHQNCHGCHGVDAVGTDIAPNLLESVQ